MTWVGYALLSAFCLATTDALTKKSLGTLQRAGDLYLVAWARLLYASPLLLLALIVIPIPPLDATFWWTIVWLVPLELTALVLYVKALRASPLSLTMPFLSLTPAFLLITSALMLGEAPSLLGSAGVLCIVIGAFVLHAQAWRQGLRRLWELIWREEGSRYMIAAAFLYSITSNLGKRAILHSSPVFFGVVYFLILSAAFLPIALAAAGSRGLRSVWRRDFAAIGAFEALMILGHVLAIVQTNVAYMIAVKRTSALFGMGYGAWWFGERQLAQRLAGAAVMLIGVALTVAG
ncbi:MAG: DMT family transporter [Nitrospirota bacterium]